MKKITLSRRPVLKNLLLYVFLVLIFSGCGNNASENTTPAADTTAQKKDVVTDPLPSWNEGDTKQAILKFVHSTTDSSDSAYVKPGERIATFDQDGTLWVEKPIYSQVYYCLDRVPELIKAKPALKNAEPFKTVLSGNMEAIAKLSNADLEKIAVATLTGMTESEFKMQVKDWVSKAKDHRWNKLHIELIYQPMLELMQYLRANGFKTYIVTGGGQDFVRAYADSVYGVPSEQVIGTSVTTTYKYDTATGKSSLLKNPKLMLNDNGPGKAEGIQLIIGKRPNAAFGNSTGDQQMLEYTKGGSGNRLSMLVLHDDSTREYAYGPAQGLPASKVGTFTQALYDEAKKSNWVVISMKNDWKTIFK
ncbi:MAG TPA: HAD family hydrolase [Puia sp.]|nr:HAD family hydrolase [Puia sp.]